MSQVHFYALDENSLEDGIRRLVTPYRDRVRFKKSELVAVKTHPGEKGNTAFVPAQQIAAVVEALALPARQTFLTDTTVLYPGRRMSAPDYLRLIREHGFGPPQTPPFIIADGLRGTDEVEIALPQSCQTHQARIAKFICDADAMIVVSHFKGHLLSGFGGAIKNLGMGCASRGGKLYQHSSVAPRVAGAKCTGCGMCQAHCPTGAITVDDTASIDETICIGCGECLQRCPEQALSVAWNQDKSIFMQRMAEYALAAASVADVVVYVNFVTKVAPDCDCMHDTGPALVADIGVLASRDPVALDRACLDLVTQAPCSADSPLFGKVAAGDDKFTAVHPSTNGASQLEHAERIGLGSQHYVIELV